MDYWDYIAHSQKGEERAGHRYYARVQVGTNKLGFPKYRYFYDAREYGAYKTRQQQGKAENTFAKVKGQTTFTTGEGVKTAKTVRDYKKPIRNAKKKITALKKEAADSHNKNRWQIDRIISDGADNWANVREKNRYGKTRSKTYRGEEAKKYRHAIPMKSDGDGGAGYKKRKQQKRKQAALEAVYQTDKRMKKAKRRAQKAGMDIRRTLRNKTGRKKTSGSSAKSSTSSTPSRSVKVSNSTRIGEKHSMDRKRWDSQNRAAQVKKDAKAYRKKRRAMTSQKRAGQKRIMDNTRERPYYQPIIKR